MAIIKGTEHIAIVPGNMSYASSLSGGWYQTSVAHNTLLRNQRSQSRSSGTCLAFGEENNTPYAIAETKGIYDGVRFVRCVSLIDSNLVLVVDCIKSTKNKTDTFDIAYHQAGVWGNFAKGKPFSDYWKKRIGQRSVCG
jgi:hypothetical protein